MNAKELLEPNHYYHVFNRGINSNNIFQTASDYPSFIERLKEYSKDVMDVFSYCLLMNHFHSLIYVKEVILLPSFEGNGYVKITAAKQLGHIFNGYAQSFNKKYDRTGALFEKPFKRKYVEWGPSLTSVVLYIHNNPKRHGFVNEIEEWPYSSYHELIEESPTFLNREKVLEWFGGKEGFIRSHSDYSLANEQDKWMIE